MSNDNGSHAADEGKTFTPPEDGSWVPRDRLNEVLGEIASLKEELAASRPKTPEISREDLLEQVNTGEITQAQADKFWEDQITGRVTQTFQQQLQENAAEQARSARIAEYEAAVPALADEKAAESQKLLTIYNGFLQDGLPNTTQTMLAALRAAFGPIETARARQTGKAKVEPHQEGGSGGSGEQGRQSTLTQKQREYYADAIRKGAYKDWDDVFATLEFKKTG